MSEIMISTSQSMALPLPRVNITVRPGTLEDVPFLDLLQKLHTKQVGWMPTAQFEGKIRLGHVLVAEEVASGPLDLTRGRQLPVSSETNSLTTNNSQLTTPTRVGYVIGNDQYFKRDDVGIIYQMNVLPDRQRELIGATLLKAMFDRAAYGCRLFCCWCAQEIQANYFWESMGFVPLAFRTGSRGKGPKGGPRVHIFWQRRIRAGDDETPYWFPSQTSSGAIREDRLVLPIPPGTHWSDAKPVVLPGLSNIEGPQELPVASSSLDKARDRQLPEKKDKSRRDRNPKPPEVKIKVNRCCGLFFGPPKEEASQTVKATKAPKPPRVKVKNDPRHVAATRELRDRWLEEVNAGRYLPQSCGKYEVGRALPEPVRSVAVTALLPDFDERSSSLSLSSSPSLRVEDRAEGSRVAA